MKVVSGQPMDEATCAALASGRAEPAFGLLIDSLMQMRGLSESASDAIAGAAFESEAPADMSLDALARAFAAIEKGGAKKRTPEYPDLIQLPAALVDAILDAEARRGWRGAGPGVRQLKLNVGGKAQAEVLRIDAGVAVPRHTHKGQELTLCLVGTFSDYRGSYGPGDVSMADPSVRHQPRADGDGPVFVLAVTDAGLRFEGLLGAIQKLMGG